jgi:GTP 3',8-cyclase
VTKIRLTGREPLVRKNVMELFLQLGRHLENGRLLELTLTSNGTQLERYARQLFAVGVRRINISLDSLNSDTYRKVTRWGNLAGTLRGIDAAQEAGMQIKINAVALKSVNEHEIEDLISFAHGRGADLTLIEAMPMGDVGVHRADQFLPLSIVRARLETRYAIMDYPLNTGGPARYVRLVETGGRVGFITPLSHNFCESCNRVRVSCTGTIYTCLGQDNAIDLREALRSCPTDGPLQQAINAAIFEKPRGHDFVIDRHVSRPAVARHMSVTGG